MIHRAFFETVQEAVQHAKEHGGWIAKSEDGTVQWFDATKWTWTPICRAVRGNAQIGTWVQFERKTNLTGRLNDELGP